MDDVYEGFTRLSAAALVAVVYGGALGVAWRLIETGNVEDAVGITVFLGIVAVGAVVVLMTEVLEI